MMSRSLAAIAAHISATTGQPFSLTRQRHVGGGCINEGIHLRGEQQDYFVKLNRPNQIEMFAAEALALQQMAQTNTIRVPGVICWGETSHHSYLVMEWLRFSGGAKEQWQAMGQNLAKLHQATVAQRFGWDRHNTIGSTPQINDWQESWADFWAAQRIGFQLNLGNRNEGNFGDVDQIERAVRKKLQGHDPQPSLVHGDLWSGNAAIADTGEPVIFDPAAYYGDREVDIAMTELFGGFPAAFYQGYQEIWPLDEHYGDRRDLYNLYHVLNHFNLFGGGYGNQAKRLMKKLF